jgi:hypothetical protein
VQAGTLGQLRLSKADCLPQLSQSCPERSAPSGENIAAPVYREIGSYVAYVKIWDAEKTALKPSIASSVTVR